MVHLGISAVAFWEACIEKFSPQVINRNVLLKNMEQRFHQCISCSAGLQREAHPLIWSTVPSSLTAESAAPYRALHTVFIP